MIYPMSGESELTGSSKITVTKELFTLSNAVSATRLFVGIPVIWLTELNGGVPTFWVTVLIGYAIFSDFLDGFLARKTNHVSELGKILDPVADKLLALLLFLYTFWLGRIPVWFLTMAIIRDLLIITGSALIRQRTGKVAMAMMSGKISVNILALYWISLFFFPAETDVHQVLLIITTISLIYSFGDYARRTFLILRGAEFD